MAINLNATTPAAPTSKSNVTWQNDSSGNVSAYVPTSPALQPAVNTTGLTGNVGSSALFAVVSSGMYRISGYIVVTVAGSVSSTLPKITIGWADSDSSQVVSKDITATQAGNTVGTYDAGSVVVNALTANNITYLTSGYASNAAGMTYALHLTIEKLF